MNNNNLNGDNPRRQQQPPPPGHPSLPPQYQQHFQQHSQLHAANQDPQLTYLLANAAAARNQQSQPPTASQSMGIGSTGNGGGFGGPGAFGNGTERGGNAPSQAAAASLFEEQILQRATALRAEALMQQQNQQHGQQQHQQNPYGGNQQQLQLQAALQAFQQQQHQLAGGPSPSSTPNLSSSPVLKQQEAALLARAAALRDFGLAGSQGGAPGPTSALFGGAPGAGAPVPGGGAGKPNLDRLREQRIEINALMRQRQQHQTNHQRAFGLEQELERVRQAQRFAAMNATATPMVTPSNVVGKSSADSNNPASKKIADAAAAQKTTALSKSDPESGSAKSATKPASSSSSVSSSTRQGQTDTIVSKKDVVPTRLSDASPKATAEPTGAKPNHRSSTTSSTSEQSKSGGEPMAAGAAAAAATAASNKTKEELRKNPGTVISAYFVIAEDAKHGENLVCSYYACRNGGIKFRYCAYCMAPVAKRNFSRRHDHGMSKNKGGSDIRDDEEEDDDDTTLGDNEKILCIPCDKGATNEDGNDTSQPQKKQKNNASPDEGNKRKRTESDTNETEEIITNGENVALVSAERRSMWNDLLNKRPRTKDPMKLSSWLNEVLAISDVDFPLDQVGAENMNHPLGRVLLNQLPSLSKPALSLTEDDVGGSNGTMDSSNGGSTTTVDDATTNHNKTADTVVGKRKTDESKKEDAQTPVARNNTKLLEEKAKKSVKKSIVGPPKKNKNEEEGFAGSFADWRDRKKGKSLKKGPSSLRK
eukprot:jgi/Psemu1/66086/estExt_Genemark1.C_1790034